MGRWDITATRQMKKACVLSALFALILCSCSTTQTISYSESRTVEPTQQIAAVAVPLIADLQVSSERITYSEKITVNVPNLSSSQAVKLINDSKSSVLFRAIKKYNADVMAAPIIDVQQNGANSVVITIMGYPAIYKNFRNATKDDRWFMQVEQSQHEAAAPAQNKMMGLFKK